LERKAPGFLALKEGGSIFQVRWHRVTREGLFLLIDETVKIHGEDAREEVEGTAA